MKEFTSMYKELGSILSTGEVGRRDFRGGGGISQVTIVTFQCRELGLWDAAPLVERLPSAHRTLV